MLNLMLNSASSFLLVGTPTAAYNYCTHRQSVSPKMASICVLNPLVSASKSSSAPMSMSVGHYFPGIPKLRGEIRSLAISISGFYQEFHSAYYKSLTGRRRSTRITCEVALEETDQSTQSEELKAKIGAKVKVRGPLKVYHVPKTPEFDIGGMEGHVKEYVGIWKGKRISPNLPYKVQFTADVGGRQVKFFAHLKENEFDVVD